MCTSPFPDFHFHLHPFTSFCFSLFLSYHCCLYLQYSCLLIFIGITISIILFWREISGSQWVSRFCDLISKSVIFCAIYLLSLSSDPSLKAILKFFRTAISYMPYVWTHFLLSCHLTWIPFLTTLYVLSRSTTKFLELRFVHKLFRSSVIFIPLKLFLVLFSPKNYHFSYWI